MSNTSKLIKSKTTGQIYRAVQIGSHGFACIGCCTPLRFGDYVADCPDCGALFCEQCVENGVFDDHICEPDDE